MNILTLMVERKAMEDGEVKVTLEVGMATREGTFRVAGRIPVGREEVAEIGKEAVAVVGKTMECNLIIPSSLNLPVLLVGVAQTGEVAVEAVHYSHLVNQIIQTWTPDKRTLPHIER